MVTINDVAKKAGVSITTVSRVLNGTLNVSRTKREKVLQVIRELNYEPLRKTNRNSPVKSNIILVITGFANDGFFSCLKKAAAEAGFQILVYYLTEPDTDADLRTFISMIDTNALAGIIVSGFQKDLPVLRELSSAHPVVSMQETGMHFSPLYLSLQDHHRMASILTQHLIDSGHHKIYLIDTTSTPDDFYYLSEKKKVHGFIDTMEQNGFTSKDYQVLYCDYGFHNGQRLANTIIESETVPDAILSTMAPTCMGILSALQAKNIKIPQDVSLATFTNDEYLEFVTPSITALIDGTEECCSTAVQIIREVNKGNYPNGFTFLAPAELIVRQSSFSNAKKPNDSR